MQHLLFSIDSLNLESIILLLLIFILQMITAFLEKSSKLIITIYIICTIILLGSLIHVMHEKDKLQNQQYINTLSSYPDTSFYIQYKDTIHK
jgi:hypothetical protein